MTLLKATLFAGLLAGVSLSAAQAQTVVFDAGTASTDLKTALRSASLVVSLEAEGTATALDLVAAARADYRRLLTALYAGGFYGGSISILIDGREAASIPPLDAPDSIDRIDIRVDPGLGFAFGRTGIAPLSTGTTLPVGFRRGETAGSDTIKDAVTAAITAWQDAGNAKAAPSDQQITANHADHRLDVNVTLDPGPVLTFGPLTVSGNRAVRTDRVRQIAGLPTGQITSPAQVERTAARLRRSGAFSSASLIEAEEIGPGNTLGYEARVVEQKPRRLGYGIEYSSVEGLGLSGYWMHRNLLGGAENLRLDATITGLGSETGGIDYQLSAAFNRPATFHVDTDFYVSAGIERLDEPAFTLDQAEAEIGLRRLIGDDITLSAGLGALTARVTDGLGTRGYTLLTLPITGEMDRRDDPLDAKSGYYLAIDATPFIGFGQADSGGRLYADGRAYRSFGADGRVTLAFRGQVGSVFGPDIAATPSDFLFYSGGGDTVRGQSYQSLGVDLGGGVTVGGLSFLAASLEARVDLTEKLGMVAFYDTGFVGSDPVSLGSGDWHAGAGLGLRYDTGIGPIRIDVATPVSGTASGGSVFFYVGIGQSF